MFYDLNVPWTSNVVELERTLSFLAELDYNAVALNHTITTPVSAKQAFPIPQNLSFQAPSSLTILHRTTLVISAPSHNIRLPMSATPSPGPGQPTHILALRPTCEKSLHVALSHPTCMLISFDLSSRLPFHPRPRHFTAALARGVRFEICYAAGVSMAGGSSAVGVDSSMARRNLIGNATALIRALRGRGVVLSSGAARVLACRGPWDVINLAVVWGLGAERGKEAVGSEPGVVVRAAEREARSWRGVIDVVYGGEKPVPKEKQGGQNARSTDAEGTAGDASKRKAGAMDGTVQEIGQKPSKRQMKKRAHAARMEAKAKEEADARANAKDVEPVLLANSSAGLQKSKDQDGDLAIPDIPKG